MTFRCILSLVILASFGVMSELSEARDFWDRFDPDKPRHLALAEYVARRAGTGEHEYGSNPNFLMVPGLHEVERLQSRNKCATFQTNLLKLAYDLSDRQFAEWSGSTSPHAYVYYNNVVDERGFKRLHRIQDLKAGDFVFWFYSDDENAPATGHAMMLAEKPRFVGPGKNRYWTYEVNRDGILKGMHLVDVDDEGRLEGRPVFGRIKDLVPNL